MNRFCRYQLLTTDVEAGRRFYSGVLGAGFWEMDVRVAPLPERLVALGVPPNWRGYVAVADVAEAAARMVGLGGVQLGPLHPGEGGAPQAILRDPLGAPFGVCGATAPPGRSAVAWHQLHVQDDARAVALYADLFGWVAGEEVDLGAGLGGHRMFAWDRSGRSAGSVASTAGRPGVHPQWLFYLAVSDSSMRPSARFGRAAGWRCPPWKRPPAIGWRPAKMASARRLACTSGGRRRPDWRAVTPAWDVRATAAYLTDGAEGEAHGRCGGPSPLPLPAAAGRGRTVGAKRTFWSLANRKLYKVATDGPGRTVGAKRTFWSLANWKGHQRRDVWPLRACPGLRFWRHGGASGPTPRPGALRGGLVSGWEILP